MQVHQRAWKALRFNKIPVTMQQAAKLNSFKVASSAGPAEDVVYVAVEL